MKMLSVLLVFILLFACVFSLAVAAQGQSRASDVTDATFTDVIMNVGSDETERNITWYSNYNTTGAVQYAKAADMEGGNFPPAYNTAVARVVAANEKGSYTYKATMTGLEANTEYVYRLVTGSSVSDVKTFDVKEFGEEFSFVYVADPQVGSSSAKEMWIDTLSKISTSFGGASFIVSGGDQIATPTSEADYGYFIVDALSSIAISTTNGPAHDNTVLYRDHYNLPNDSSTYGVSGSASDYYYTYNNVLFMHVNVENENAAEHLEFIDRAIENNPNATWQIVVIHHSYFSGSSASTNTSIVNMGKALAGELNARGIDAVLSGHDHFYARSELMNDYNTVSSDTVVNNTVTDPEGTLYICGGSSSGSGFESPNNTNNVVYQNDSHRKNIIKVSVTDGSLSFEAYFVDGDTPELFDSFTIIRTEKDEPVSVSKYSVTYVTDTGVDHGDDISQYRTISFAHGQLPDAPYLVLPAGSFEDGVLYEWYWVYKDREGNVATSFTAGNEYTAYLTANTSRVSDHLYISTVPNESEGIYSWVDAWDLALSFPDVAFTFTLTENMTMTANDKIDLQSKSNVTLDLAGYTLNTKSIDYLLRYYIGTTDSSFSVISSKAGGKIEAKELVRISSNHLSTLNISYGSAETESITGNLKYLVYAEGNFKRGSTLNLNVTKGTYTLSEGIIFVANASDDLSAANHYKVDITDANITLGNSPVRFSAARKASATSYINAVNCNFTTSSGTVSIVEKDQWYGSFSFNNCALNGITFDASSITNISGASFGTGTVFTNSDVTFNADKTAFAGDKLSLATGCSLYVSGNSVTVTEGQKDPDNLLRIGNSANHSGNVYTFSEAWNIAMGNPGVSYVFMLNEDITISRGIIKVAAKTDVVIDLNGYTFTGITDYHYLISYQIGSTGSKLSLISSREGGKLVTDNLVVVTSGGATVIDVTYGSDDGYPIFVETVHSTYGYLVYAAGNFKGGSTLNLSIKNGTYNLCNGLLYVNNYGVNINNTYKVDISNSVITIGTAGVDFNGSFRAVAASYINASNTTFKANEGNKSILALSQWDGSFEFDNCIFNGIVFDASTLSSIMGATFNDGCSFVNSDASFNSDKTAFASDKITIAEGCILKSESDGSVSVSQKPQLPDNVYLIANTPNHEAKIYTWSEAWEIAKANPNTAYVFRLNEDFTISSGMVKLTSKTNVTLDLNGYTFTSVTEYHYLISYQNGSTGSSLSVISSREGGKLEGYNLVCVASGGASVINLSYGSDDGYPITVDLTDSTYGYLAYATGNFKGGSTLNLSVKNGTYNLRNGLVYVNNYGANTNDAYKIDISNSVITIGNAGVVFSGSFRATAKSYVNATNTTFAASEGNKSFLALNQWDGSLEFNGCTFNGIIFGTDTLASVSQATFNAGCRFINSDASFNSDKTAFASAKASVEEGYSLLVQNDGSIVIGIKAASAIDRISITLSESIAINLYAALSNEHTGAKVKITMGDNVLYIDGVETDNGIKFVFDGIGPQSMTEIITAELVYGDEIICTIENISVKNYCDDLLAKSAEELDMTAERYEKLRVLITNLLRYGATAQLYKGSNTDNLADANIDESLLIDFTNPNKKYSLSEVKTPGIEITGANVWFDSVNRLRIRFTTTDVENTTVRVGGKEYGSEFFMSAGNNTYVFTGEPILPCEYDDDFTFELCLNGEVQHSLVYGMAYYVTSMQNSTNENTKRMVQALYSYCTAVVDYFLN